VVKERVLFLTLIDNGMCHINGSTSIFFNIYRWLRKGFFFSPLLFLIITKRLNNIIKEIKISKVLLGVKVGRYLTLSNLLFVDDIILFLKGVN
jgi:hypothetical protein